MILLIVVSSWHWHCPIQRLAGISGAVDKMLDIGICQLQSRLYRAVKADFAAKMSIVVEEADESAYWLEFVIDEKLLGRKRFCRCSRKPKN